MKLFTRGEIVATLAKYGGTVPGVILNYSNLIASLSKLEFDVSVNEVRFLMGQAPHPDTIMGVPVQDDRGLMMIHAPNIDREGDDKIPEGYEQRLTVFLEAIAKQEAQA